MMMATPFASHRLCLLLTLAAVLSSVGCTTTPSLNKILLLDLDSEPATKAAPLDPNTPQVTVMLISSKGKTRRARVPFQEGMLVSHVVKQTSAAKKFRRQSIELMRQTPRDHRPLRMHVKYDRKQKRVSPGSDYALHPGDVIQVIEDASGALDDFLGDAIGPLGAQAVQQSVPSI